MPPLLVTLWWIAGCDAVCPDNRPSCEDRYPAARLAVHDGGEWSGEHVVWTDASGQLTGTLDDGSAWSASGVDGVIAIGQPDVGQVAVALAPSSQMTLADGLLGTFTDPALGFGSRVIAAVPGAAEPADLWVTAPQGATYRGELIRYAGGLDDPGSDAALRVQGPEKGDKLGDTLVACPDLTGDDRVDWIVGLTGFSGLSDPDAPTVPNLAGAVALIGSEAVLATSGTVEVREVGTLWWGSAAGEGLGAAVACGDLTGDGVVDLAIGAPWSEDGRVYLLSGADLPVSGPVRGVAWWQIPSPEAAGWFGAALAVGDFDGDGVTDLAVGAPGARGGRGAVLVYDGVEIRDRSRGIAPRTSIDLRQDTPMHLGRTLATARLAPDGFDDLVVGTPDWRTADRFDLGRVFVFDGADNWPATLIADEDESRVVVASQAYQRLGRRLAVSDLDGDGNDDLLLPARDKAPP